MSPSVVLGSSFLIVFIYFSTRGIKLFFIIDLGRTLSLIKMKKFERLFTQCVCSINLLISWYFVKPHYIIELNLITVIVVIANYINQSYSNPTIFQSFALSFIVKRTKNFQPIIKSLL